MTYFSNGGEYFNYKLNNAYDGDFNTFWKSQGVQGKKYSNEDT